MIFTTQVKLDKIPEKGKFATFVTVHILDETGSKFYYPKFWVSNAVELPKELNTNDLYDIVCSVTTDKDIVTGKDTGRGYLHLKKITKARHTSNFFEGVGYLKAKFKKMDRWDIENNDGPFTIYRLMVEDEYGHSYLWHYGEDDRLHELEKGVQYQFTCCLFNKRHLINGYPSELPEHKFKGKSIFYTELMVHNFWRMDELKKSNEKPKLTRQ